MALQLQDFAERYTAAWCSHDAARVAEFFSPDGSLKVNDAPAAVGREAITEVASGFMRTFPDLKVLMDGLSSEKGRAVYRWTLIGTHLRREWKWESRSYQRIRGVADRFRWVDCGIAWALR